MNRSYLYFLGLILFGVSAGCAEVTETQPQTTTQVEPQVIETQAVDNNAIRKQQMSSRMSGSRGSAIMAEDNMPAGAGPDLSRMQKMRSKMFGGGFAAANTKGLVPQQETAALEPQKDDNSNKLIKQGKKLFEAEQYELAAVEFENFLRNHEFDDLSPEALYYLGECYFRLEKYQEAITAYKKIDQYFQRYPLAPDALYRMAKCYEKINQPKTTQAILKQLKTKYPQFDSAKFERKE